jgi:hypothetical protein
MRVGEEEEVGALALPPSSRAPFTGRGRELRMEFPALADMLGDRQKTKQKQRLIFALK